jgi:hypothetical protein
MRSSSSVRIQPTRLFSDSLLTAYRQQGDASADTVITSIVAGGGPAALRSLMQWLGDTESFSPVGQPEAVTEFWRDFAHLPDWAEPARMARAMAFFKKHAGAIGLILGCYSLPYCYLGADGAQVLWLTERIKNDTARRLQETGDWLFAVSTQKNWQSVAEEVPQAISRTLKVRLLHAGARWFAQHSNRWDTAWGVPVNQEDMAGTNLAFSHVVLLGLRRAGIPASEQEEADYLHHVNVIGWLNGVDMRLLPQNMREANRLGQAIGKRQFRWSEAGEGLTRSLLNAIAKTGGKASGRTDTVRNLAAGEMRFFLGDRYADILGIPPVSLEKRLASVISRLPIFDGSVARLG